MNLVALDHAIGALCSELGSLPRTETDWRLLAEEDLLHEATICIFGSQMLFEVAVAAANRVRASGLLSVDRVSRSASEYKACLLTVLSDPLAVEINGEHHTMLPRFRNRLVSLLASTVEEVHGRQSSLQKILSSAQSARHARALLIKAVTGFGPKQASLYLRRVGFSSDLAVLDTHVLDYLRMSRGIDPKPGTLSRLCSYECIEAEFERVANDFGHRVGCVDLAVWVTMRVAKRGEVN